MRIIDRHDLLSAFIRHKKSRTPKDAAFDVLVSEPFIP